MALPALIMCRPGKKDQWAGGEAWKDLPGSWSVLGC